MTAIFNCFDGDIVATPDTLDGLRTRARNGEGVLVEVLFRFTTRKGRTLLIERRTSCGGQQDNGFIDGQSRPVAEVNDEALADGHMRVLTQDVKNPCRDGRKRYGAESKDVFPAGTAFRYEPGENGSRFNYVSLKGDAYQRTPSIIAALLDNSMPRSATTWRELIIEEDKVSYTGAGSEALEVLLRKGIITVAQARDAMRAAYDEEIPA